MWYIWWILIFWWILYGYCSLELWYHKRNWRGYEKIKEENFNMKNKMMQWITYYFILCSCDLQRTLMYLYTTEYNKTITNYVVLYSYKKKCFQLNKEKKNRKEKEYKWFYYVAFTKLVAGCCLVLVEWQTTGVQILLQVVAWCWLSGMWLVWCLIPPIRWKIKINYSYIG
jgi:hypothetical protein